MSSPFDGIVDPDRIAAVYTRRPKDRSGVGGRPQQYVGDVKQRRAACERARRARGVDPAAARAEIEADPSGITWTIGTRRWFAAELDRWAAACAGLNPSTTTD
jgi:hypothetical protein